MADLVVLLLMFMAVADISACKQKGRKIQPTATVRLESLENAKIRTATSVRLESLENPNFEIEYPPTRGVAKLDFPDALVLPLNVYLSPSWRRLFPDQEGVTKAKEVLSYVKELFIDNSLRVKMLIVYEDMDIVPFDKELEVYDLEDMEYVIPKPRLGRAAIVYLTKPLPKPTLGISYARSICDVDNKLSRSIVGWDKSSILTAKTVAHEIGHNIGMSHDYALPAGKDFRNYICGPEEPGRRGGNQLMNYDEPIETSWSVCSNDDFKNYYKRVALNKEFCLRVHVGSACSNVLSVRGNHFANGFYKKAASLHNNRVWYEHAGKKWCIFYGRHWQVDACNFVRENKNQYQGYGWSESDFKCPGNIGPNWRYYSWVGPTNSGPIDTSIVISPLDFVGL